MMSDTNLEELLAAQRKERKELTAKTQKMKHSVPKGDKKKKKEVTAEITQLLANLDLKHENEIKVYKNNHQASSGMKSESVGDDNKQESFIDTEHKVSSGCEHENVVTCNGDSDEKKISQKLTKAQKRRNKKAAMEKERNKAIADQELENLSGLRHSESERIKEILLKRSFTIYEIPSDGNCLYKAIEHQLSALNLKPMTVETLREETSQYMLSHMEYFSPFLTSPETGNVLNEEQYKMYCEDVAKTSAWGGHIELQALSHICGVPIEIIQADGPSIVIGDENINPKLILCYHRYVYGLGEHYNSVVPATE